MYRPLTHTKMINFSLNAAMHQFRFEVHGFVYVWRNRTELGQVWRQSYDFSAGTERVQFHKYSFYPPKTECGCLHDGVVEHRVAHAILSLHGLHLHLYTIRVWMHRGDGVTQVVERRTRLPKTPGSDPNPHQEHKKNVWIFPSQKCCAGSLSMCPTPVCKRTHNNDHVRTLKIL